MSWAIGYDDRWQRDIGYGVPAYCDHPRCKKEIDRGLSYVCGGVKGGEYGCGLYFCGEHQHTHKFRGSDRYEQYCKACIASYKTYYKAKPDHPDWIKHKLTHSSWKTWRKNNKNEVEKLTLQINKE